MRVSLQEQELGKLLRDLPRRYNNRYTVEARNALLYALFNSLVDSNPTELRSLLFPNGLSEERGPWNLSDAQGAVEGAEYTEAARGKRCGHIFRNGETTYSCRTCTNDETCVLCTKCFEASDHEGHQVTISMSPGMTGCCDCGDEEAWIRPVNCSIHSEHESSHPASHPSDRNQTILPERTRRSVKNTVAKALDYFCDVYSCAPEQMRFPKSEKSIRKNERLSRLNGKRYGGPDKAEECEEYGLVLWNDEKHAMDEVVEQVARACRLRKTEAKAIAVDIDKIGRKVVTYSTNIEDLISKAKIIGQIKLTVTIRSARDLFREEMCSTIVDWLSDIAGCSVGNDHHILMDTICEEMLGKWRLGSSAINLSIAKKGIIDHEGSDDRLQRMQAREATLLQRLGGRIGQDRNIARQARIAAQLQANAAAAGGNPGRVIVTVQDPQTTPGGPTTGITLAVAPNRDELDDTDEIDDDEDDDDDVDTEPATGGDFMSDDERAATAPEVVETDAPVFLPDEEFGDRVSFVVFDEEDEMDIEEVEPEALGDVMMEDADGTGDFETDTQMSAVGSQRVRSPDEQARDDESNEDTDARSGDHDQNQLLLGGIPKTPKQPKFDAPTPAPHWVELPKPFTRSAAKNIVAPHEDLNQRVRIDFLVLYDLRMWKVLRNNLRHLYISTVVRVATFKRILGLRFAALYTWLAQLYLVADREPDHSIISLSLQMLTTPSITAEIVERGRFFTKLLAILYTFLTKRQVGHPDDVDLRSKMAFEQGVITNRRIHHFFSDLRFLLEAPLVQQKLRDENDYLLQFLDFLKLFQGICPSIRAVNEHVEYESDTWFNALYIVRESTHRSRQFCEAFKWHRLENPASICRAIRQTTKATIINSLGLEADRFDHCELKGHTQFKSVEYPALSGGKNEFEIVEFNVAEQHVSFTHLLHYTLSWFIESGKSMSRDQLKSLLYFSQYELQKQDPRSESKLEVPEMRSEAYLLALFDMPLRVCAWIAQIRAGMWIRNGHSLRAQMSTYRSTPSRETTYQRDVFMMQVGFIVCDHETFLASAVDRFGLTNWMKGNSPIASGPADPSQTIDLAEDLLNLLINIVSDRTLLRPSEDEPKQLEKTMKRDIIHVLCFKAMSHSELQARLSNNITDNELFPKILLDIATYRPPEGLSDSGSFELKKEYIEDLDPYYPYFNKNQREEAENLIRNHYAKINHQALDDVFYEPKLIAIKSGIFSTLSDFTQTALFAQIIGNCLKIMPSNDFDTSSVAKMKLESFLQVVLHLTLTAVLEDTSIDSIEGSSQKSSFLNFLFSDEHVFMDNSQDASMFGLLFWLLSENAYPSVSNRIRFVLRHIQKKWPRSFAQRIKEARPSGDAMDLLNPPQESGDSEEAKLLKKKQAAERQARVMASFKKQQESFLENQDIDWGLDDLGDSDEEAGNVDMLAEETTTTWNFPKDRCIVCQEDTNENRLYGTLAYFTESRAFRRTDLSDPDYVGEACIVPSSLDRSHDGQRPFGVASRNIQRVPKTNASGDMVIQERRGLGRGFPRSNCERGTVMTSCGHIMHWSCFETYDKATQRRHDLQLARNHPERTSLREFVCPMCKALGNTFLPIIFKPKEYRALTEPDREAFEEWLTSQLPPLSSTDWSGFDFSDAINGYLSSALQPTFLENVLRPATPTPAPSRSQAPTFLTQALGPSEAAHPLRSRGDAAAASDPTAEVENAWRRLQETIKANFFSGQNSLEPSRYLGNVDELTKTLAYTISSTEIAQRGAIPTDPSQFLWLNNIPDQQLTHLRIFSETVTAYVNVGWLQNRNNAEKREEFTNRVNGLFKSILNPQLSNVAPEAGEIFDPDGVFTMFDRKGIFGCAGTSFLSGDIFSQLTECSVFIASLIDFDMHSLVWLFYLAEVVKVTISYLQEPAALVSVLDDLKKDSQESQAGEAVESAMVCSAEAAENFTIFVQSLLQEMQRPFDSFSYQGSKGPKVDENPNTRYHFDRLLRHVAKNYSLPFLRKAALLMHLRGNIDLNLTSSMNNNDLSEIDRLCDAMKLPRFDNLVSSFLGNTQLNRSLQTLTQGWIWDWAYNICYGEDHRSIRADNSQNSYEFSLPHPGIYELVALPTTHDTLNGEAILRRCPTTGEEMNEPALCLFCGAFVCCQTACCSRETGRGREGGCYQHMKACDGTVGMFLKIRKCTILFLNFKNGSYFQAPYLDRHGETDVGLRRKEQLFLNPKRYDKLFREVWLNHGVQSAISRKLESEQNTGGWESL